MKYLKFRRRLDGETALFAAILIWGFFDF